MSVSIKKGTEAAAALAKRNLCRVGRKADRARQPYSAMGHGCKLSSVFRSLLLVIDAPGFRSPKASMQPCPIFVSRVITTDAPSFGSGGAYD